MSLFNFLFRGGFKAQEKYIDDLRASVAAQRDRITRLEEENSKLKERVIGILQALLKYYREVPKE